ncbi:hypothetical protein [Microbacterium gorillae]|uniref:hypothetical protein n=1 Tax=Microbacterium gorillae TaxID=1231063 RepID=UPI00058FF479|nr:hypothetical protein [Microbacterium gorillae]
MTARSVQNARTLAVLFATIAVVTGCTPMPDTPSPTPPSGEPSTAAFAQPLDPPTYAPVDFSALLARVGEDTAASDSGTDSVYYPAIQGEWSRVTAAWPLPVPEEHPFPDDVPVANGGTLYTPGSATHSAAWRWSCAATATAIESRDAGDDPLATYWLHALRLWWTEGAPQVGFEDVTGYVDDAIRPAEAGEWGPLAAQHATACPTFPTTDAQ